MTDEELSKHYKQSVQSLPKWVKVELADKVRIENLVRVTHERLNVSHASDAAATRRIAELEAALEAFVNLVEVHEVTCFSCDRDGERYCDCIKRETERAKAILAGGAS